MKRTQSGFTLVELAIVLVVIGLILGMAFKGKDLIDSAKVKNMQAQFNKISAGMNIFFEKYGFYPGDGCQATHSKPSECTQPRNGLLDDTESQRATVLLQNTNILTNSDFKSPFGQDWVIVNTTGTAPFDQHTNYVTIGTNGLTAETADSRFVCALDKLMDDGMPQSGLVRSTGTGDYSTNLTAAAASTLDCWALQGQTRIGIRILP